MDIFNEMIKICNSINTISEKVRVLIDQARESQKIFENCLKIIKDDPDLENYKSSDLKRELLKGVALYEDGDRKRQDS